MDTKIYEGGCVPEITTNVHGIIIIIIIIIVVVVVVLFTDAHNTFSNF